MVRCVDPYGHQADDFFFCLSYPPLMVMTTLDTVFNHPSYTLCYTPKSNIYKIFSDNRVNIPQVRYIKR